jgi:bifunctional pyridoxal-dependent enzyme with beta-cystathionase and maltose regulon repressor activities
MTIQDTLIRMKKTLEDNHQFSRTELLGSGPICDSTQPISLFLAWLETNPKAQSVLNDLDSRIRN